MEKIIFDVDSYKVSHWEQMPPNTSGMFSYLESRGGLFDKTVFFGMQYYLKAILSQKITIEDVDIANDLAKAHGFTFNYDGWKRIATVFDGKIPVRIRSVKEGSIIPTSNLLCSIESLDPETFWVVNWLETTLLRLWHPINVATISYHSKVLIQSYLDKTADNPETKISFMLHDFGARGVSSSESAGVGGLAHLINFMGTDTIVALLVGQRYYNCKMAGFSIPASEHSTITSWGQENETKAYKNMLIKFGKPGATLACVSDSYDIFNACENIWGGELKQEIIDSGATLVIRPDSGEPCETLTKMFNILADKFGYTINGKGYKVLNHVRSIWGDGINYNDIDKIYKAITDAGFSAENLALGMGGGLLQQHNRDTLKFAIKCSSVTIDGKEVDVYKDPVTDKGKKSKRGRLDLIIEDGKYKTVKLEVGQMVHPNSVLQTVFENGEILIEEDFETIRNRAAKG